MTTLDHRILIPSPVENVWGYIGNLENNPQWQVNCVGVVYLSQKHSGIGTRWRQQLDNRQEYVFEISTWYDLLGYEYTLIDGGPFKNASGRIRLQEIAEGTIVQWSFNYDLGGGVFGSLRNSLSTERYQDNVMIGSLKTLWKQTKRSGGLQDYTAKSLMKDGPQDPIQRATYTSKHRDAATPTIDIPEPPISDEDTKPRPSVANAETLPATNEEKPASPATEETVQEPTPAPQTEATPDEHQRFAPPATTATDEQTPTLDAPPTPVAPVQPQKEEPEPPPANSGELKPVVPPGTDTAEMSIWEVFGIPSPTDTQKMRAIQAGEEAAAEYEAEQEAAALPPAKPDKKAEVAPEQEELTEKPPSTRSGLRAQARRRLTNIRRPGE